METFKEEMLNEAKGKVLVKFGAPWCGPCNMIKPHLEQVQEQGYTVYDVNVDEQDELSSKYAIRGVPTLIIFEDGLEVARASGMKKADEIITWMNIV